MSVQTCFVLFCMYLISLLRALRGVEREWLVLRFCRRVVVWHCRGVLHVIILSIPYHCCPVLGFWCRRELNTVYVCEQLGNRWSMGCVKDAWQLGLREIQMDVPGAGAGSGKMGFG